MIESIFRGSFHTYEDGVFCKSLGNRIDAISSEWGIVTLPKDMLLENMGELKVGNE